MDKRIAVETAQANKFSPRQSRNHGEDAALLGVSHFGLKPDQVVQRPLAVFLTQLNYRVGPSAGALIDKSDCAHRPERQSVLAAVSHLFNGHAAFERHEALETMRRHAFGANQRIDEAVILLACKRQVQVIVAITIVARGSEGDVHVDGFGSYNWRDRIIKVEMLLP